jgi:alcohol oxidase
VFDKRTYKSSPQDIRFVKARKLVVVAAEAMGSRLILERSGIGHKDILERAGIPVVSEIPGVGENYQGIISSQSRRRSLNIRIDHSVSGIPYTVDPNCESMNQLWRGDTATCETTRQKWENDGSGMLGTR